MTDANCIFHFIKNDLEFLEKALYEAVTSSAPLIGEIGAHLVRSGGKRLRPALCLLAARSGPSFDRTQAIPLATAIELIHMASLVHDDVIDCAGTRRGALTANARWGNQAAVLTGDHIFAQAFSILSGHGYTDAIGNRLSMLVKNLCAGEILQDMALYTAEHSVEEYERRIGLKTADFLALCCEIGAMAGGADEETTAGLKAYGRAVGMAFQITDDLLDIMGDAERLGKPAGNDIRQGVVTLPVIRAMETSAERDELRVLVTDREMTDEAVVRALRIVHASDGCEFAQARADAYIAEARRVLPAGVTGEIRECFLRVADYIAERDF